jgi:hypothetical protein
MCQSDDQKEEQVEEAAKARDPLFSSLPFEEYEYMTPTQQFSFEKAIETERRSSNFNLEVCHICQGCH